MPPSVSSTFRITAVGPEDRRWIATQLQERWGAEFVVARGVCYAILELDGFVAWSGDEPAGLLTYLIEGNACEIVTIDSFAERKGIGTALLDAVAEMAGSAGCCRLTLITTNDNLNALRFYQKRGFRLIVSRGEKARVSGGIRLTSLDNCAALDSEVKAVRSS